MLLDGMEALAWSRCGGREWRLVRERLLSRPRHCLWLDGKK